MAQRPHVPAFGKWENDDNIPYTLYFDKARKGRGGGKMINPNDPQENPDMFPNMVPPAQASPSRTRTEPEEPIRKGAARSPVREHPISREDGDFRQLTDSPARNDNTGRRISGESQKGAPRPPAREHPIRREDGDFRQLTDSPARNDNTGRRISGESQIQRHGGRPVRQSVGPDHTIDRSPLHPHYQVKVAEKGSASPGGEGKNSSDGSHGAPGRSKPVNRGEETPNRVVAVPKFGDWGDNPDGYTGIFDTVLKQKHEGTGKAPGGGNEPPYTTPRKLNTPDDAKCCCFPWGGK